MNTRRTTTTGIFATIVMVAMWQTPPAHAQITAPREAAQIEFGPMSIYPTVRFVDVGRDENVFNDTFSPKEDWTFTLASRALTVTKLGLNELMFAAGSDYVWFKEHASERSTNLSYALRFNLSASRWKPFVGAERVRTRTRPSVEIDTRAERLDQTAVTGANFDVSERTAISASVRFLDSRFDDSARFRGVTLDDALNRTSWTYSSGVRYAITPLTTLAVNGNYTADTFRGSHLRDSKFYSVTPVIEFSPEAVIHGKVSAGYQYFSPEDPGLADSHGLIFESLVNWSFWGRTTFDVSGRRNINYSYQDTEPMYLQTGARLMVTQRLVGPLNLQGSAERQHLTYRWRRGVSPTPRSSTREDTADVFGGGVLVDFGRGFTVLVGVEKARRRSIEDPLQNFNRTRLISNFTVGQ